VYTRLNVRIELATPDVRTGLRTRLDSTLCSVLIPYYNEESELRLAGGAGTLKEFESNSSVMETGALQVDSRYGRPDGRYFKDPPDICQVAVRYNTSTTGVDEGGSCNGVQLVVRNKAISAFCNIECHVEFTGGGLNSKYHRDVWSTLLE